MATRKKSTAVKETAKVDETVAQDETAKADGTNQDDAPDPTMLRVSSYAPRFCRAGRRFTPEPVEIPLSELSDDELERLESEANLKTERV